MRSKRLLQISRTVTRILLNSRLISGPMPAQSRSDAGRARFDECVRSERMNAKKLDMRAARKMYVDHGSPCAGSSRPSGLAGAVGHFVPGLCIRFAAFVGVSLCLTGCSVMDSMKSAATEMTVSAPTVGPYDPPPPSPWEPPPQQAPPTAAPAAQP